MGASTGPIDSIPPAGSQLPSHLSARLDEMSWEAIADLSTSFEAKIQERKPEVVKLHKEISMTRLLLLERAREQGEYGKVDPALLVDMVRLLERCENLTSQYGMDLDEFNKFLTLMVAKVKRHKLIRHEGAHGMVHFKPMDESELDEMKKKSEKKGRK